MQNDNLLTTDARATIMDACQSISRSADEMKAGCADGDEWDNPEVKAEYDAELRLLERLTALLAAHPGQPEPRAEVTDELIATAGLLAAAVIEYPDFDGDAEHDEPRPLRKIAEDVLAAIDAARTGASS